MLKVVRNKLEAMMHSRHARTGVFFASMAETTLVPIPIEVVLLPLMISNRKRAWQYATAALLGCLAGACIGYGIGLLFFETAGQWIIEAMGLSEQFESAKAKIDGRGFWYILFVAISPVPFQLAYLGAGAVGYSFLLFLLASAIGRSVRYYGLVVLVHIFGKAAGPWLKKHETTIAIGATVAFIAVYAGVSLIV